MGVQKECKRNEQCFPEYPRGRRRFCCRRGSSRRERSRREGKSTGAWRWVLESVGIGRLGAHFDAAAHAVEGHGDDRIALRPADGPVFGIVQNRPNAGLGLDEALISIVVVLGHKVVNRGVLIEIVGGVGFAFGGGAVSDVIVGIGNFICSDEFIADVVAVVLVIDKHTATAKEGRSPL